MCAFTQALPVCMCVHLYTLQRGSICMFVWLACTRVHAGVQSHRYLCALFVHACVSMYTCALVCTHCCTCACVCVCVQAGSVQVLTKLKSRLRGRANCSVEDSLGGMRSWGLQEMRSSTLRAEAGPEDRRWSPPPRAVQTRARAWTQKALMLLRP